MADIASRLDAVRKRLADAQARFGRAPGGVTLLAVSKTRPAEELREALAAGQSRFGESYLQEALEKVRALRGETVEWHFIGPLQSNKTKDVAAHFDWVHSLDRLKLAQRLSAQRPAEAVPLQVCLQVNISGEASKSGVSPADAREMALRVAELPRLRLRGLMAIPAPQRDFERQRPAFRRVRELATALRDEGIPLDTLSMGMSADLEAAVAEGSTLVRIGTAIFGPRPRSAGHKA